MSKSTYPGHVLGPGSHGSAVQKVQHRLNEVRAENPADNKTQPLLKLDGDYGANTTKRVRQFQRHHDGPNGNPLGADGKVGRFTWASLFDEPLAKVATSGDSGDLGRLRPNVVVDMNVACQSARTGVPVNLIVLHDTESHNAGGNSDLQAIGNFFNNPSAQASSHVCTDGDGNSARYVKDSRKAWHVGAYNSASLGIEQIGFATQTAWPEAQLRETARWVAHWSIAHGIPIQRGAVSGTAVTRAGVLSHSDLGTAGGGHHDPGPAYPVDRVLELAQQYKRARQGQ